MSDSIREQLQWATDTLSSISDSARLDSEVLLAHCLQKARSYLFTWPERRLNDEQQACFHELVRRRLRPEPVAYLVGCREFYALELNTTSATLVPRPETEMLVEFVLEVIADERSAAVLELGTGTGAIAIALKHSRPEWQVSATDISVAALAVAKSNIERYGLAINLLRSDWYAAIPADHGFDVIVSNPPYIAAHDPYLSQGDLPAEPHSALCSGPSGLEALEIIVGGAGERLGTNGWLVLEHGHEQGEAVRNLLRQQAYCDIETRQDFKGLERMTVARSAAQ